jgi:hypothetical protein
MVRSLYHRLRGMFAIFLMLFILSLMKTMSFSGMASSIAMDTQFSIMEFLFVGMMVFGFAAVFMKFRGSGSA